MRIDAEDVEYSFLSADQLSQSFLPDMSDSNDGSTMHLPRPG